VNTSPPHGARIAIFDPFIKLFRGESIDKPEQVRAVFDVFDELLDTGQLDAVIVAHHENVGGKRTAGSFAFEAWPSSTIRITRRGRATASRLLKFEKVRVPGHRVPGQLEASLVDGRYVASESVRSRAEGDDERGYEPLVKAIRRLAHFHKPLTMKTVMRGTRATKAQIEAAVDGAPDLEFATDVRAGPGRRARLIVRREADVPAISANPSPTSTGIGTT
jgi:hypothetical protein